MILVDTHCHLDMIDDPKIALLRAKEAGISKIINVGTSIDASRESIEIAEGTDLVEVFATCGIHAQEGPKDIKKYGEGFVDELKKVAKSSKKVVGIGECGLDYFLEGDTRHVTSDKEKAEQRELFRKQVKLANELDLPLVIHCRNAWEETFSLLSTVYRLQTKLKGVFHSWTGDVGNMEKALDLGFYISFSGILTFKNAPLVQEVAKKVSLERIVLETDSPFLTPRGSPSLKLRGASRQNEPKNVKITAEFLANLRSDPLDKISEVTTRNAESLFRLSEIRSRKS